MYSSDERDHNYQKQTPDPASCTCGVVTTPLARWANFKVDKDSAKASAAGETMASINTCLRRRAVKPQRPF